MSKVYTPILLFFIFQLSACGFFQKKTANNGETVLARVQDNYLYLSEIEGLLNSQTSAADSIKITKGYIDKWIRQHLMFQKADDFLPAEKINIDQQVNDYRESLIVFLYERELVKKNPDTLITDAEILDYYNTHQESFRLKQDIIKAKYFIVQNETPNLELVRNWFKDDSEEYIVELQEYGFQFATHFNLDEQWFTVDDLIEKVPISSSRPGKYLQSRKQIEMEDSLQTYFVKILEFAEAGDVAPLSYRKQDIKKIIVNKRKLNYIKGLKDKIYQEALGKNDIEIYYEN